MDATTVRSVAQVLADARRSGRLLGALPAGARPKSVADAHAIQDATLAALGETITGWKVSIINGEVARAPLIGSRTLASPARLAAKDVPMLGLEAEIAFRFERALPPRERAYEKDEIADAVTALAAIEVVDTRFASYADTPILDRLADFMSNGAFIAGTARPDWRSIDLAALKASLVINGVTVVEQTGGHVTRDPILPAVALVNALRAQGIPQGRVITTGTFTGLHIAKPGDRVAASFEGFGSAALLFA
ncbi:MAG TPA: fumarylacetoacetate hydrolase family protein [Xanthobacteraceae bacterium]|nr:fumarylacetoacetate hydrolase family protein [Xanthobacteraceae bacterium]